MFCRNCGSKLRDDAVFCFECGAKVKANHQIETEPSHTNQKTNNSSKTSKICIIGAVCLFLAVVSLPVLPTVFQNISVQQEAQRIKDAIENAFDTVKDAEELSCYIEATAQLYTTVNGSSISDAETVKADVAFKENKVHAENGKLYTLMTNQQGGMHIEDIAFESYITESKLAYVKKDEGSFERVSADFSKDDMLAFFDEVEENYKEAPQYHDGEEEGTLVMDGSLEDGTEIYNTYIGFLALGGAEPEDYPISGTMNYNVTISKETETVQSIRFYLSDVEHIWLGWGDDDLQVDNAYGELEIQFKSFSDIEDFKLPSVAEEAEQTFGDMPEWKRLYMDVVEDETVVPKDFRQYAGFALKDLDQDGLPELFCYDDSIRTTYLYAIHDGIAEEMVEGWGDLYVKDNLIFHDYRYGGMSIYQYSSGKVDRIFYAERDDSGDDYHYDGKTLSYEECWEEAKKVLGGDDFPACVEFAYDYDSIKSAIMDYDSAEVSSAASVETTQEAASKEDSSAYLTAYEKYVSDADRYALVYINDDSIPELITGIASWYNFYTYDNDDVIDLDLSPNVFAIIEKENLIHTSSGHGTFHDYIGNLKEGAFECIVEGTYGEVYDANGKIVPDTFEYYWEGEQVSKEEYNNSLAQIFDAEKAISSNDLIFYSSIQEAYENIGKVSNSGAELEKAVEIDVEKEVEKIRSQYYKVQNNLDSYMSGSYLMDGDTYYYEKGFPVKILIKGGHHNWDYSREYFYRDDKLYFAFVYQKDEEHRLYFKDGILIRYIDENKNTYNYGEADLKAFDEMKKKVQSESVEIYPDTVNCGA